jgi:uncharacterized protein YrrD
MKSTSPADRKYCEKECAEVKKLRSAQMQFKDGTNVLTADGKNVGRIDRVVLEPDSKEVTHLVIEKGVLFTEDKVVPISLVGPATADKVTLRKDEDELEALQEFQESHYVHADMDFKSSSAPSQGAIPLYRYPPIGSWRNTGGYTPYAKSNVVLKTEKNIPKGTIALQEGAEVVGSDGKTIGKIEQIFTDSVEDRATHLLISEGLILKEKRLIPTQWIRNLFEDEVHISVSSEFVNGLPEYQLQE